MALPVTLDDARRQLRVDGVDQNEEIEGFIQDAADWVESYTGHILEPKTVTQTLYSLRRPTIRAWPIAAEPTLSVTIDDGSVSPVSGVRIDAGSRPARLLPAAGTAWPRLASNGRVYVEVAAGYADPADVPRNFIRAMLVLIGAYDADREGGEVFQAAEVTARRLCSRFKAWTV